MLIAAVQGVASGDPFAKCALTATCQFPMLTVNHQPRCACITVGHSLSACLFAPRSLSLLAAPGPSSCGRASRRRPAPPRSRPSLTTACPRTASSRSAWRAAPPSPTPPWILPRRFVATIVVLLMQMQTPRQWDVRFMLYSYCSRLSIVQIAVLRRPRWLFRVYMGSWVAAGGGPQAEAQHQVLLPVALSPERPRRAGALQCGTPAVLHPTQPCCRPQQPAPSLHLLHLPATFRSHPHLHLDQPLTTVRLSKCRCTPRLGKPARFRGRTMTLAACASPTSAAPT
jgi:hypothetical protein